MNIQDFMLFCSINFNFAEETLCLIQDAAQTLLEVSRKMGLGLPYIHPPTFESKEGHWPDAMPGQG